MIQRTAFIAIKADLHYRRSCFESGFKRLGYRIRDGRGSVHGERGDVLVIWNRNGNGHRAALDMEAAGGTVIVAENGYLAESQPYHLALSLRFHNGAGKWHVGGPERWDALGIELKPWRTQDGETVILPQRGIGSPGVAMPHGWAQKLKTLGRIRHHPGCSKNGVPLERDLKRASAVITWGSGAALRALLWGIPVYYGMRAWIGATAARPLADKALGPKLDDEARLAMFRRLAWAQSTMQEIETGVAIDRLIQLEKT